MKENGTPTQLLDSPTMQTPILPPSGPSGQVEAMARLVSAAR